MSESVSKGAKRPSSRPVARSVSSAAPAKNRKLSAKTTTTARPKPLAKRSGAEKAPVLKATKNRTAAASSSAKSAKKSSRATAATAKPTARPAKALSAKPRAAEKSKTSSKTASKTAGKATAVKTSARPAPKPVAAAAKSPKRPNAPAATSATAAKKGAARPVLKPAAARPPVPAPAPPRQPTLDEAAALRAFERAHKEFVRGRFAEARTQFRTLIEQHSGVAEVTARARTYLAIAEARMRSESAMPRNAEELYDRGVIELNRGDFVAAQEMFERALKRDPEAAHIYYGLAATRARLGALEPALQSLGRALEIQPNLRVRAQHDPDLAPLRNEPEYERLIFASRP
ncbi:MAG TPA: tetratricopeptide repeat protein [Pyrinomonadaceae bacterium]|nr:tetratricopeptide repeat protein [Pyrinomonadaceae bacterium]